MQGICQMLPHTTKPKCKRLGLSLNEALDILDYDKDYHKAYAHDKRGAIEVVRNALSGIVSVGKPIEKYETNQCIVSVYKTELSYLGEDIYVLTSVHKKDGKLLIRFGNEVQIGCIVNSYFNKKSLM